MLSYEALIKGAVAANAAAAPFQYKANKSPKITIEVKKSTKKEYKNPSPAKNRA